MKDEIIKRTCPKCGDVYTAEPEIDLYDQSTPICPKCRQYQGLHEMGLSDDEIKRVAAKVPYDINNPE